MKILIHEVKDCYWNNRKKARLNQFLYTIFKKIKSSTGLITEAIPPFLKTKETLYQTEKWETLYQVIGTYNKCEKHYTKMQFYDFL